MKLQGSLNFTRRKLVDFSLGIGRSAYAFAGCEGVQGLGSHRRCYKYVCDYSTLQAVISS